jgi:hypothetical protein
METGVLKLKSKEPITEPDSKFVNLTGADSHVLYRHTGVD